LILINSVTACLLYDPVMTEANRRHKETGLSQADAETRLATFGPNRIAAPKLRSVFSIMLGTLKEPMFLFMLSAAILYLIVGDLAEGAFLVGAACASMGLVVFQDARSENALNALRDLVAPQAHVMRDGAVQAVSGDQLVPGDIIIPSAGERFPADADLISSGLLTVDESALTGEAVPVGKQIGAETALFAGTMIISGEGLARITETGSRTRIGAIGAELTGAIEQTPLQKTTGRLVVWLSLAAFMVCGVIIVAYGLLRGDWLAGGLAGLTAAIALLPEEFPLVLAVFLAMGSLRLAKRNVLVRRAAVVETLGAITLLCVDKTGTLTQNQMTVGEIWTASDHTKSDVIEAGILASAMHPVDPMDKALHAARESTRPPSATGPTITLPLSAERLSVIQAWPVDKTMTWAAKGAPEAVMQLCNLQGETIKQIHDQLSDMAARGMRVLAVAQASNVTPDQSDVGGIPFQFMGLTGFVDPLRDDVPEALAQARLAGIDVAMITGDFPETALAIADQAGLHIQAGVMTGAQIDALSSDDLQKQLGEVRVFARVSPAAKLKLIEAFQVLGHIVAMTGDGVNDAPALERAHVGIAMGNRGTDVAREAADLVLLDDSFASIINGVKLGRRIFANLRKALGYVLAIHVPIAGLALLPIIMGLPPMLYPMHIVMLELIIDPVSSLVFEAEPSETSAMSRPPRPIKEALFGWPQMVIAAMQGFVLLAGVMGIYVWSLSTGAGEETARALGFTTLIIGNLVLALVDGIEPSISLFDKRHRLIWIVTGLVGGALSAILYVPWLAAIFKVEPLNLPQMGLAIGVAVCAGGWFGIVRLIRSLLKHSSKQILASA
jgi:P-type Ca2+ transporter type 2C